MSESFKTKGKMYKWPNLTDMGIYVQIIETKNIRHIKTAQTHLIRDGVTN